MNEKFKKASLIWMLAFICLLLWKITSAPFFNLLIILITFVLGCLYTYLSPWYFLNLSFNENFSFFRIGNLNRIILGIIIGMPFATALFTNIFLTFSFPDKIYGIIFLFVVSVALAGMSFYVSHQLLKTNKISIGQFKFIILNFKLLGFILILQILIYIFFP